MKSAIFSIFFPLSSFLVTGQEKYRTYCNPIDIDYTYVAHNSLYRGFISGGGKSCGDQF